MVVGTEAQRGAMVPRQFVWRVGHLLRHPALIRLLLYRVSPGRWRNVLDGMPQRLISLRAAGVSFVVRVRVADTPLRQAGGFQSATPDAVREAPILFDFGKELMPEMHMRNVAVPLDVAFANANGCVISLMRMLPGIKGRYRSPERVRYALEAYAGFFDALGLPIEGGQIAIAHLTMDRMASTSSPSTVSVTKPKATDG